MTERTDRPGDPSGCAATHRLYGVDLLSDYDFATRLAPPVGAADLTFTCVSERPGYGRWEQTESAFEVSSSPTDGESRFRVYRRPGYDVAHFAGIADFYIESGQIVCHVLDPGVAYMVEICLLGFVMSYWLERHGTTALHASAVDVDGRAVGFLAGNGGGKSSLAAAFVQEDHPLLTDDVLAIDVGPGRSVSEPYARPGYPQMRMWPDQAGRCLGGYRDLERVHPALEKRRVPVGPGGFGAFCSSARPLARLYLPDRRSEPDASEGIRIIPIGRQQALIELVRSSFLPNVARAVGWDVERLHRLSRLVKTVRMARLVYPSGAEYLPGVCEAILRDLDDSPVDSAPAIAET